MTHPRHERCWCDEHAAHAHRHRRHCQPVLPTNRCVCGLGCYPMGCIVGEHSAYVRDGPELRPRTCRSHHGHFASLPPMSRRGYRTTGAGAAVGRKLPWRRPPRWRAVSLARRQPHAHSTHAHEWVAQRDRAPQRPGRVHVMSCSGWRRCCAHGASARGVEVVRCLPRPIAAVEVRRSGR